MQLPLFNQDGTMNKRTWMVGHQEFLKREFWPVAADKVSVKNLKATTYAGLDIWGRKKRQPVEISVTVAMKSPFNSAAKNDQVDASTVHYGKLSKLILENIQCTDQDVDENGNETLYNTSDLTAFVGDAVEELASSSVRAASRCEVFYPKASTLGAGAGAIEYFSDEGQMFSRILFVKDIRIPTLIGVNGNERAKKQLVIINIEIDQVSERNMDGYNRVEEILTASIENTAFETLEALGAKAIKELHEKFLKQKLKDSNVTLRLEKPSAVPFADGPVVELYRTAASMKI